MYKPFAILAVTVGLVWIPTRAIACSWIAPPLTGYVQFSQVIVVGTVENATESMATIKVESYLKGDRPASTLTIDNYLYDTGASCSPLRPRQGHRFVQNEQVLLFLEADASRSDLWHPVGVSDEAAFPIKNETLLPGMLGLNLRHDPEHLQLLEPPFAYFRIEGTPVQTLVEAKRAIADISIALQSIQPPPVQPPKQRRPFQRTQGLFGAVAANCAILGSRLIARS
jgi:hypothetical protein